MTKINLKKYRAWRESPQYNRDLMFAVYIFGALAFVIGLFIGALFL
jgi:GTP cyclohydrolase III